MDTISIMSAILTVVTHVTQGGYYHSTAIESSSWTDSVQATKTARWVRKSIVTIVTTQA